MRSLEASGLSLKEQTSISNNICAVQELIYVEHRDGQVYQTCGLSVQGYFFNCSIFNPKNSMASVEYHWQVPSIQMLKFLNIFVWLESAA